MNTTFLSIILLFALVVVSVLVWNEVPRRLRLRPFRGRGELSVDQIYTNYFATKGLPKELVCELWNKVARQLRIPPGVLRPTDRFAAELAPPLGWEFDDEIADVEWAAERRLKETGIHPDLSQVETLGDYIELLCRMEEQKNP